MGRLSLKAYGGFMITLIIAYFVICMIMGTGKMCIDEFSGAAEKERKERIQQIENEKQKKREEARKKFEEQLKKEREAHEALIALERKAHYAQLEEKMKNFDCDKTYEELKNKKNLSIDEMGLLYKAASMKKEKLEEKKQLLLDRAGVQLTIDDWTKQQAKDKERQEAIDAIKNKDGQISFFNEITEEQIQKQIIENKRRQERESFRKKMEEDRQERELFRKKMEEDRKKYEQWMKEHEQWKKEMNKKFEKLGLETRFSLFEQDINL
jgi:hypothetical protein